MDSLRRVFRTGCSEAGIPLALAFVLLCTAGPSPGARPIAQAFDLTAPPAVPAIFAPGVVSLGHHEHHLSLSPDGRTLLFVMADKHRKHHVIVEMNRIGDGWTEPEVAAFSGMFSDFAPAYSPDGMYLLFCSDRPTADEEDQPGDVNIWKVVRDGRKWGTPEPLPSPVNDESPEYNPSVAASGNIYFQDHDAGGADLYLVRRTESGYGFPEKLPAEINSPYPEIGPWISPDETLLLFSSERPGGRGGMDMYLSRRTPNGPWSPAVNLGLPVNTPFGEAIPTLSPDGRALFYVGFQGLDPAELRGRGYGDLIRLLASPRNGDGTLYWVDFGRACGAPEVRKEE
ncbi:MAG: hypothetical protein AB1714_02280 [Acidobacteriota bacterium]